MKMQKKKCLEGYHQQEINIKNFFDVASYINIMVQVHKKNGEKEQDGTVIAKSFS